MASQPWNSLMLSRFLSGRQPGGRNTFGRESRFKTATDQSFRQFLPFFGILKSAESDGSYPLFSWQVPGLGLNINLDGLARRFSRAVGSFFRPDASRGAAPSPSSPSPGVSGGYSGSNPFTGGSNIWIITPGGGNSLGSGGDSGRSGSNSWGGGGPWGGGGGVLGGFPWGFGILGASPWAAGPFWHGGPWNYGPWGYGPWAGGGGIWTVGPLWNGGPWGGGPWGYGPWGGGPWGGGPWGYGPWGGGPWEADSWDTDPWDTDPWDTDPWDTDPWDTDPWKRGPRRGNRRGRSEIPGEAKPGPVVPGEAKPGPGGLGVPDSGAQSRSSQSMFLPGNVPGTANWMAQFVRNWLGDKSKSLTSPPQALQPQTMHPPTALGATAPNQRVGGVGAAGQPLFPPPPAPVRGGVGAAGQPLSSLSGVSAPSAKPTAVGTGAGNSSAGIRFGSFVPGFGFGFSPSGLGSGKNGPATNNLTAFPKKGSVVLNRLLGFQKSGQGQNTDAGKKPQQPGSSLLPPLPKPPDFFRSSQPPMSGAAGGNRSGPASGLLPTLPPPPSGSVSAAPNASGSGQGPGSGLNSPLLPALPPPPPSLRVQPPAGNQEGGNFLPDNWTNDPKLVFDIFTSQPIYVDDPIAYRQNPGGYFGAVGGSAINSLDSFSKQQLASQNAAIRALFPLLQNSDGNDRPRFPVYWHDLARPLAGASDSDIIQGKPVGDDFDQPLRYLSTRRRDDATRDVAEAMYRHFSIPFGGLSTIEMARRLGTIPSHKADDLIFDSLDRYYVRPRIRPSAIRDNILQSTAPQYLDPYYKAMQRRWSRMFPGSNYNLDLTFDENFRQLKGQGNAQGNQSR